MSFNSTKIIELGSCAFRQPRAKSHCRFLHGYRLQSKIWFGASELDNNNWVVDFGSLKGLKEKLQKQFDHTTCIDKDDPHLEKFKVLDGLGVIDLRVMPGVGIEKTAEFVFDVADSFIKAATKDRCWVEKVEVWEHEKNSATYTNREVHKTVNVKSLTEKPIDPSRVDWDKFRDAENCGTQPNPRDFYKEEEGAELDNYDTDGTIPEQKMTPSEYESQQQQLPGAKRDKNAVIGARVGNVKSQGLGDPFAGTSWGSDKPSDPIAPPRG
jgi:6-pyruvoyltetrahydropterin/6-carboxytetrahydropterin synthase